MNPFCEARRSVVSLPHVLEVTSGGEFARTGVVFGRESGVVWAVLDPHRHALVVWGRHPSGRARGHALGYARAAAGLGATVFTNGPMMGRQVPGLGKLTRARVLAVHALAAVTGGGTGYSVGSALAGRRGGLIGAWAAAAVSLSLAHRAAFDRWVPCGGVRGTGFGLRDTRDFDSEGARHAWFGRSGSGYESYAIGAGDLPEHVLEGMGGVIPLLRNGHLLDGRPGEEHHHPDFQALQAKRGVVAWGLAPVARVLMIVGGRAISAGDAARVLRGAGVTDAVATDQRGSIMLGRQRRHLLPRPSQPRQRMQQFGFACLATLEGDHRR